MFRSLALITAAIVVGSCGADPSGGGKALAREASPAEAADIAVENELYEFNYRIPAEANAIPALAAKMERRAAHDEAEVEKQAREVKLDADANGYPFRQHYLSVGWDVAADLPGWLSLSAGIETYSGGAHGNQGFDALLWDRTRGREREVTSLFTSRDALRDAIRPAFCDALNRERQERRGEAVPPGSDDMFDACIDPLESTVVLGSEKGGAFDQVTILVGPYMAGPYVEGSYVIDLPVTGAVLAAVRPEFRDAFAAVP